MLFFVSIVINGLEWMKRICPCFTSVSNHAHGKRSRNSLPWLVRFQLGFSFFLFQTRDCTTFSLHDLTDFYVERVTAHRIKINDHSCFGGPTQPAYSAYREDRLCVNPMQFK